MHVGMDGTLWYVSVLGKETGFLDEESVDLSKLDHTYEWDYDSAWRYYRKSVFKNRVFFRKKEQSQVVT